MNTKSKNTLNYIIDLGQTVSFIFLFGTGIIKFPSLLGRLGIDSLQLPMGLITIIHDWSGIVLGVLIFIHIVLHFKWMVYTTKELFNKKENGNKNKVVYITAVSVLLAAIVTVALIAVNTGNLTTTTAITAKTNIIGKISDTSHKTMGRIQLKGLGTFEFDPSYIETVRKDIFRKGHFSIFDVLVYLDNTGKINMKYHFDKAVDSYVIDSINGKENWWYMAAYDGGNLEKNSFRIDYYPYKDKMSIQIIQENKNAIEARYSTFRDEVKRKEQNGGKVILPEITIQGKDTSIIKLKDITIAAHNLRNDIFQDGVITSIDVILTLADLKEINCDLHWYESIGAAGVVKDYFVNRINDDVSSGRCGFIFETGSYKDRKAGFRLLHIPADTRVLCSPEYMNWMWKCL